MLEAQFLAATEYHKRWGFDWSLYRPLVEFCRKNGMPVAALNALAEMYQVRAPAARFRVPGG